MRILWVTNVAPIAPTAEGGGTASPMGGWISSVALLIGHAKEYQPLIAFPSTEVGRGIEPIGSYDAGQIRFSPKINLSRQNVNEWRDLIKILELDVVHIFGTELPHSAVVAHAAHLEGVPIVVTLQGLVSVIAGHMADGVENVGWRHMTLRSAIRRDSIRGLRRTYLSRGKLEMETLRLANYVLGRTEWDFACARQLAPQAAYHQLNETLRGAFYEGGWEPTECKPMSIVMSQANNPLKGLHFALETLMLLREKFPAASLTVAGRPPYSPNPVSQALIGTQYGSLIRRKVKKLGLDNSVRFVGLKNEIEMKDLYLSSNAFLSASSIENESNSLSEAKSLALPCVASFAGGVASRIEHGVTGYLYQHDAPYMAAYYLGKIFEDTVHSQEIGLNAQREVRAALDPARNLEDLLKLYSVAADSISR